MKIKLVSHASIVIETHDTRILCDPWFHGKAFNDSWALWPPPAFTPDLLEGIDYIWLSHEHPDHLHFPTLASFPGTLRRHVVILFQDNNPERIFAPLRQLGYRNFRVLTHRRLTPLTDATEVYCYRVGTLDSCLGVASIGYTVFNVNDARLCPTDYRYILEGIGHCHTICNQFSLAVKDSVLDYTQHGPACARHVLQSLVADHHGLHAEVTIPFASFMYFATIDNAHMNAFANTPAKVYAYAQEHGVPLALLYPGDTYTRFEVPDPLPVLARFGESQEQLKSVAYDTPPVVQEFTINQAWSALADDLRAHYPHLLLLDRLHPLHVRIPDLDTTVSLQLQYGGKLAPPLSAPDVEIYSQPLHYLLAHPWGMGTLTNSARFVLLQRERTWRAYKALFALHNAGVFLRPKYMLRRENWNYLRSRLNTMRRYPERSHAPVYQ